MPREGGGYMTPKQLWKRASASVKDNCSLCLARTRRRVVPLGSDPWNRDLEATIIKATSHDEGRMDIKYVGHVFSWVRTCPSSSLPMLLWMLGRRVGRTRSWAVALKGLILAHGILLCRPSMSSPSRLPFDLSGIRGKASKPGRAAGKAAFVLAYFNFLDQRVAFAGQRRCTSGDEELACLQRLEMAQDLLDLLMQVQPSAECMDLPLILEAMNRVAVEIFDVYSSICDGVEQALLGFFGHRSKRGVERVKGRLGIRIIQRATVQGAQLSSYFELCKALGVLNDGDVPDIQRVPEENIVEIERLLIDVSEVMRKRMKIRQENKHAKQGRTGHDDNHEKDNYSNTYQSKWVDFDEDEEKPRPNGSEDLKTVVTTDWVLFEDPTSYRIDNGNSKNPFVSPDRGNTPVPPLICYDTSYYNHHFIQPSHSDPWLRCY